MKTKRFQRKKEDFVCDNCGAGVIGNGYTNHCPKCLYSKHVDVNPGDRQAGCGGLMRPAGLKTKNNQYQIIHRCLKCGHVQSTRTSVHDDFEKILKLSRGEKW
ncbi:MAG: RNHCP domain-containing protein [bacterium]|nr:RNHCP domain-containing protein [bacterium]